MNWAHARRDKWQDDCTEQRSLPEFMGMSPELYARWADDEPKWTLGLDEVGYGALAGPLVVGGVLAPANWSHPAMKDSKAFKGPNKERNRAEALAQLEGQPVRCFLRRVSHEEVDRMGVYEARMDAFARLVQDVLSQEPDTLVVLDGDDPIPGVLHVLLPAADSFVPHVSAASIVAKVFRDTEMTQLAKEFPLYDFAENKGYGSDHHREALRKHGLCPIHRKSYKMKFLKGRATTLSP
jgi:ribonuclease HII